MVFFRLNPLRLRQNSSVVSGVTLETVQNCWDALRNPKFPLLQLSTGTSTGTCGNALSSYVCIQCLKNFTNKCKKTFCEKMGRVGRSMCTETTQSSQTRLWAGVVSCMLQLIGGGAQFSRSLPVGSSTTSSFGGRGSSVKK